jgi:MFS family permease
MPAFFLISRTFSPAIRLMLLAQSFMGLSIGIFAVLVNLYLKSLGYDEVFIGRFLGLQAFVAAISSIPLGRMADAWSRSALYILGVTGYCLGYCFFTLFSSTPAFLLSAVVTGLGSGAMTVAVQPFLQENSRKKQRSYVFSLNFSLSLFMGIAAGAMAGWIPRLLAIWMVGESDQSSEVLHRALWLGVIFSGLALFPALRLLSESNCDNAGAHSPKKTPPEDERIRAGAGGSLAVFFGIRATYPERFRGADHTDHGENRLILKFMMCSCLVGCGAGLIIPFFNLYFRDWVGANVGQIGLAYALGQLGTGIGGLFTPTLKRRIGLVNSIFLTEIASLPFMLLMANHHGFLGCLVCYVFRGALMNMGTPMRQELLMERISPSRRARAAGAETMAWYLGWAVSMMYSGWLIQTRGYGFCLYVTFLCYLTSGILYYKFFRKKEMN